jgi:uncharacterized lipoprotein YddW (UPF0748 family)
MLMEKIVKLFFISIFILFCSSTLGFHTAVQIFSLHATSRDELEKEFQFLRKKGVETIIFRCFKNPGDTPFQIREEMKSSGVYFKAPGEPIVSDLLPLILEVARQNGLRTFGWITTRKCAWMLKEHPEWEGLRFDITEQNFKPGNQLDLFLPAVQNRLEQMIMALANTDVDGILIQDDWVSRQGDDFNTSAWNAFSSSPLSKMTIPLLFNLQGPDIQYTSKFHLWSFIKSRNLSTVLGRIISHVKASHPSIEIAANLYYETILFPGHARAWLSQDLEELMRIPIDRWAIMAYQKQMQQELREPLQSISEKLQKAESFLINSYLIPPEKIFWKVQTTDWISGKLIPSEELVQSLPKSSQITVVAVPYRNPQSITEFLKMSHN